MGELIGKLLYSLGTILRYIASGFVALIVLNFVDSDFELLKTKVSAWMIVLSASLIGVFIYAVHKGFLFQPFWFIVVWLQRCRKNHQWINKDDLQKSTRQMMFYLDTQRWKRRVSDDQEAKGMQAELDKWSALLNFLYCSAYATIFVPIFIRIFRVNHIMPCWMTVSLLGVIVLIFALISDWRETNRELWATKVYPDGKKKNVV